MSEVKIPESIRVYFSDPSVVTATEMLLDTKTDTKALVQRWEDLPKQFESYLAAHQIKAEYVQTLWVIWENVWKPVLEKHGLTTENCMSLEDLAKSGESDSSISEIWDGGYPLQRIWKINENQLNFGVDFGGTNYGLRLLCWINSKKQTRELHLNDQHWLKKLHDHGWRLTKSIQIGRSNENLQIDDLIQCAEEAVGEMLKFLKPG